jgi:hypothetical protein
MGGVMARSWYEVLHWGTDGGVVGYSESTVWRALRERAPMPPSVVARLIRSGDFRLVERALRLGCIDVRAAMAVLTAAPVEHAITGHGYAACVLRALDIIVDGDAGRSWGAMQHMAREGATYTAMATFAGHRACRAAMRARDEAELVPLHQMVAMGSSALALEVFEKEILGELPAADLAQIRGDTALTLARALDDYSGAEAARRRALCLARCASLGGFSDELRSILGDKALQGQLRSPGSADVLLRHDVLLPEDHEASVGVTRRIDAMAITLLVEGVACEVDGVGDEGVSFLVTGGTESESSAHEAAHALLHAGLATCASARYDEDSRLWIITASLEGPRDRGSQRSPRRVGEASAARA